MSSPRFGRGLGNGNPLPPRAAPPESTTSAFSTTSYDSYTDESRVRDKTYSDRETTRERSQSNADREARDTTYSSRDVTRDSSYYQRDVTASSKRDVTFLSDSDYRGETSTDTERHGSYDFRNQPEEKIRYSCDEAGACQKLSFLLLVVGFLGRGIAVCTPYWVVGYEGGQMTVYEGVWLSCYRERLVGGWVCSTFDTIRHLFEQPTWYEASQVSAVLSVVLLMLSLLVATLYSFVVDLSGRSRASWLFIIFTSSAEFCTFLSLVIFTAAYPWDQTFPPGELHLHASFALHIISCLLCLLSLAAHVRDSYPDLKVWENKMCASNSLPAVPSCGPSLSCASGKANVSFSKASKPVPKPRATGVPKLGSFSLPKFPAALSRFRSSRDQRADTAIELQHEGRETTGDRVQSLPTVPSPSAPRTAGKPVANKSFVSTSGDSMSGHDSQV